MLLILYQKQKVRVNMGNYGIKISKEGYDVKTATPSQLIYSSKWSNFKIYTTLDCTVTLTGTQQEGTNTVANPLPYPPVFFPYVQSSTIPNKWRPALMGGSVSMPDDYNWGGVAVFYNLNQNLFDCYISHIGTGTRTFTFKIILFVDQFSGTPQTLPSIDNFGIKIAKEGVSVLTAKDSELSMTSKYSNLTVALSNSVSVTDRGDITHNLGYVPIYLVWFNPTGDSVYGDAYFITPTSGIFNGTVRHIEVWADSSKLYFSTEDSVNPNTFKYLIFYEKIV